MPTVDSWVALELETAKLRDARLIKRMHRILGELAARPNASIPQACEGPSEMHAANRFFDNGGDALGPAA